MKNLLLWACFVFFTVVFPVVSPAKTVLETCYEKQCKLLGGKNIYIKYRESQRSFFHSEKPWLTYGQVFTGECVMNSKMFIKRDSVVSNGKLWYSRTTAFNGKRVSVRDNKQKVYYDADQLDADISFCKSAAYGPYIITDYFYHHAREKNTHISEGYQVYSLDYRGMKLQLYADLADTLVKKISYTYFDDFYGDITILYRYGYDEGALRYCYIKMDNLAQGVKDTVWYLSADVTDKNAKWPDRKYFKITGKRTPKEKYTVEKYNDRIHFIILKNAAAKAMVVEFKDYLLVAEAPLNSENGEAIIRLAQKLHPGKPVRYFVFSHFHPHYSGGLRAFVHKGITIVGARNDLDFAQFLVNEERILKKDSLAMQPRALKAEPVDSFYAISDGNMKMEIYNIGPQSHHTKDFLVYYFPGEKMLFNGELGWISDTAKTLTPAGAREEGLYQAIADRHLQVETIEQAWPVNKYHLKSAFTFSELEEKVNLKHKNNKKP